MKYVILASLLTLTYTANAQKSGVNTKTPTENFDINGTVRVRSLPNDGATNAHSTTGTNTASASKDQTFTAVNPVVADANGVIGQTDKAVLVPLNKTNIVTNASTSMMVVRRYTVIDDLGGTDGKYSPTRATVEEFDTGMDVTKWEAFMSNAMWVITEGLASGNTPFLLNKTYNYRLKKTATGNWKIIGDIANIKEKGFVDILFIQKSVVAADPRLEI